MDSMPKFGIALKLSRAATFHDEFHFEWKGATLSCVIGEKIAEMSDASRLSPNLYENLKLAILRHAVGNIPSNSRYFPAARSGILQAHRLIAPNIVRDAPYAGIENTRVPRLSGVVSDLVSSIIDMHPTRGAHHGTGMQIESDILGGHMRLKYADPATIPEIAYDRSEADVPIHRASSTISELAPFTLHLKHRVDGHGMLIIEEPEAHLHPRNQSRLAGHIVKLVRDGANIVITTHSSTLFESISQYLRASRMEPEGRKNAFGRDDLYLAEDEVAPHLFKTGDGDGSVVERINMSAEDGIEQEEFVREDRLLNETNLRIEAYSG